MSFTIRPKWASLAGCFRRFRSDDRGQIVIIFALSSTLIVAALGVGIDLARAYSARQKLSEVAALTCQFAVRASIVDTANSNYSGSNGFTTYTQAVNAFAATSLRSQNWVGTMTTPSSSYFVATPAVGGTSSTSSTGPTGLTVEFSGSIPTTFMQLIHPQPMPVHAKVGCATAATTPQIKNPKILAQDGFETPCASYCYTQPNGSSGTITNPTSTFTAAASYTGSGGLKWFIVGYCLETDMVGQISSTTPEGTHSAELDCDNGSGSAGNSSISTNVYLPAGNYELRYNYRSRVDYPNYDPTYICGSTASDVYWANDTTTSGFGNALRTNQINVYLDMGMIGGTTPTHTTIGGAQTLAGTNLIDMCVYSPTWIERSVRITVTTPSYYWLTFAADGANDSYGGQLDNVRLCQGTCDGSLQDNFPTAWLPANNGGANKVLFEDTFESPVYTQDYPYHYIAKSGNLALSTGTTGTIASGWPNQASSGWFTGPFNQVTYAVNGAYQGQQYIALDGYNANSANSAYPRNRLVARPFYLDPGYYQVSYDYISMVDFGATAGAYGTYCYAAPGSGQIFGLQADQTGTIRYYNQTIANGDTNILGVFMTNGLLISTPGSAPQGSATPYTNLDGSTATYPATPALPPDAVNYQNYNAGQMNPLIDVCGYSDSYRWIPRTVSVMITKPGVYWLTFSANDGTGDPTHTGDGNGPGLDDVKLTALGSPYMTNPPTTALTAIPVPSPAPGSSYTNLGAFTGFSIVVDPIMAPAPYQ